MRIELLKIIKRINKNNSENDFFDSDYSDLRRYINNLLASPFWRKNAKELIKNMDILLSYTNNTNNDWLMDSRICLQEGFLDSFINNIRYFKYSENIDSLFYYLSFSYDNSMFNDKMINLLSRYDISQTSISSIMNYMNEDQKLKFIKALYYNNKPIVASYNIGEKAKEFVAENIDGFIKSNTNLFLLKNIIADKKEAVDKVNNILDNNFDLVVDSVISNVHYLRKVDNNTRSFIYHLLKDVVENEKVENSDIKNNARGGYSSIVFVGDKVIKIGFKRQTPIFPNNPYIIKPLFRREITTENGVLFVEVTQRVKTGKKVSNEVLYSLYKGLRDIGLIWTDIHSKNVGMLLKDNEIYWNEKINPDDKTLSLDDYRGDKTLKAGDYVILDADYIFYENDPKISYVSYARELEEEFNKRYMEENRRL